MVRERRQSFYEAREKIKAVALNSINGKIQKNVLPKKKRGRKPTQKRVTATKQSKPKQSKTRGRKKGKAKPKSKSKSKSNHQESENEIEYQIANIEQSSQSSKLSVIVERLTPVDILEAITESEIGENQSQTKKPNENSQTSIKRTPQPIRHRRKAILDIDGMHLSDIDQPTQTRSQKNAQIEEDDNAIEDVPVEPEIIEEPKTRENVTRKSAAIRSRRSTISTIQNIETEPEIIDNIIRRPAAIRSRRKTVAIDTKVDSMYNDNINNNEQFEANDALVAIPQMNARKLSLRRYTVAENQPVAYQSIIPRKTKTQRKAVGNKRKAVEENDENILCDSQKSTPVKTPNKRNRKALTPVIIFDNDTNVIENIQPEVVTGKTIEQRPAKIRKRRSTIATDPTYISASDEIQQNNEEHKVTSTQVMNTSTVLNARKSSLRRYSIVEREPVVQSITPKKAKTPRKSTPVKTPNKRNRKALTPIIGDTDKNIVENVQPEVEAAKAIEQRSAAKIRKRRSTIATDPTYISACDEMQQNNEEHKITSTQVNTSTASNIRKSPRSVAGRRIEVESTTPRKVKTPKKAAGNKRKAIENIDSIILSGSQDSIPVRILNKKRRNAVIPTATISDLNIGVIEEIQPVQIATTSKTAAQKPSSQHEIDETSHNDIDSTARFRLNLLRHSTSTNSTALTHNRNDLQHSNWIPLTSCSNVNPTESLKSNEVNVSSGSELSLKLNSKASPTKCFPVSSQISYENIVLRSGVKMAFNVFDHGDPDVKIHFLGKFTRTHRSPNANFNGQLYTTTITGLIL